MQSPFVEERPAEREFEVIPPVDSRQLVENTLVVPHRWVCSLDIMFENARPKDWKSGDFGRGSGLLVGPRLVLTAAHNLYPDGGTSPSSVYVAPARNGRRDPLGRVRAVAYRREILGTFEVAVVLLERGFENRRHAALGNRALGHWGSERLGHGTRLETLPLGALANRAVTVCGYPGDRCGTERLDLSAGRPRCPKEDWATTQWTANGTVARAPGRTDVIRHSADTARGDSGSPVWTELPDGRRCLMGVHQGFPVVDETGTPTANTATYLTAGMLRLIGTWP